jgi:hypothetical protein
MLPIVTRLFKSRSRDSPLQHPVRTNFAERNIPSHPTECLKSTTPATSAAAARTMQRTHKQITLMLRDVVASLHPLSHRGHVFPEHPQRPSFLRQVPDVASFAYPDDPVPTNRAYRKRATCFILSRPPCLTRSTDCCCDRTDARKKLSLKRQDHLSIVCAIETQHGNSVTFWNGQICIGQPKVTVLLFCWLFTCGTGFEPQKTGAQRILNAFCKLFTEMHWHRRDEDRAPCSRGGVSLMWQSRRSSVKVRSIARTFTEDRERMFAWVTLKSTLYRL